MLDNKGFDLWADGYDKAVGLSDEENTYPFAGYKDVLGQIYREIMEKPGATVLDIGFGTGTLTTKLYENGCTVYGQDFSARMIELASAKMPEARLFQGDIANGLVVPLLLHRYDFIVATYSLHHLTDEQKTVFLRILLEQLNENGVKLREIAHEYGATTGRPRRTGWLDMCVVKYAAQINGLDCIALTRLDILDTFPEIKICTGYRHNGRLLNEFPASLKVLGEVEPVYETLPGWNTDTSGIREYGQLPPNCRRYVERIGELAKTRIGIVSVGPDRDQTIVLEPMF